MSDSKITEEKVYLMVTITTDDARGFNTWWNEGSLPFWEKFGAKHIGSWVNWVGGPKQSDDEIIRIFEFDNFDHYGRWEDWLHSSEAKKLMGKIASFNIKSQRSITARCPYQIGDFIKEAPHARVHCSANPC